MLGGSVAMRLQEPVMLQPVATRKKAKAARLTGFDRIGWFPPDQAGCDRLKPLQPAVPDVAILRLSVRLQYLPGLVDVKSAKSLSQKVWHGFVTRAFHRLKTGATRVNGICSKRLSRACSAFMLLE